MWVLRPYSLKEGHVICSLVRLPTVLHQKVSFAFALRYDATHGDLETWMLLKTSADDECAQKYVQDKGPNAARGLVCCAFSQCRLPRQFR